MTKLADMQNKVAAKISSLQEKAKKFYGCKVPNVEIKYDLKTTSMAGQAIVNPYTGLFKMRLHPAALQFYGEDYIESTVVHEFAHLVQRQHYPLSKPHGKEWKSVMLNLGVEPSRCHSYDLVAALKSVGTKTTGRKVKTYSYKCACDTYELTVIRHNRILKGTEYHCKKCKTALVKI